MFVPGSGNDLQPNASSTCTGWKNNLITRGGRSKPTAIEPPNIEWPDNPVEPVQPTKEALLVQKRLLEDIERLCSLAERCGDTSL